MLFLTPEDFKDRPGGLMLIFLVLRRQKQKDWFKFKASLELATKLHYILKGEKKMKNSIRQAFFFFGDRVNYVAQAGLKLPNILPLPPEWQTSLVFQLNNTFQNSCLHIICYIEIKLLP